MMLYDKPKAEVSYCMVNTPFELCKWENQELHQVDHIEPRFRVTSYGIERDLEIEKQIEIRCKAAIEFYANYINKLNEK
jgi:hypothetical protein